MSGQDAFPALPDPPAPAPPAPAPAPAPPAPAPPALVVPVGKFQRGGERLQYKTVKYLITGGPVAQFDQKMFEFSRGAVDPWTYGKHAALCMQLYT